MRLILLLVALLVAAANAVSLEKLQDLTRVRNEMMEDLNLEFGFANNRTNTAADPNACNCDSTYPIAPCCQTLNVTLGPNNFSAKYTPGFSCDAKNLTSCESCTDLAVCRWSESLQTCNHTDTIEPTDRYKFTDICGQQGGPFQAAQLVSNSTDGNCNNMPCFKQSAKLYTVQTPPSANPATANATTATNSTTNLVAPVIAEPGEMGMGSGCDNVDYDKYPTGIPGCDSFVNENAGQRGIIPTDMISDARLPVGSHVPPYPLYGNPNLPDVSVNNGGDYETPQDDAGWSVPDWNHNGCLGGACERLMDDRVHIHTGKEHIEEGM